MTPARAALPRWVLPVVQSLVAVALLAILWRAADGPRAAASLLSADLGWLAMAFVALSLQTVLSALRWQLTARQLGIALSTSHAIREYYLAQVVNQSLPGGMIGDAGRAVRARAQAGLLASSQAVVFERLAGQIAMLGCLAVAFVVTNLLPGGFDWPRWLALPVGAVLLAAMGLTVLLNFARRLPGAAGRGMQRIWRPIDICLASREAWPGQVVTSLGTALCNLAAFSLSARAVGVELDFGALTSLVPLILFAMLIPISVAGWGVRESAAAALLPLAGASASDGLAASVAFGLTFIVAVLPGLAMLWTASAGKTRDTTRV